MEFGQGSEDPLGLAGRPRRVEHRRPELLVGDGIGRILPHHLFVGFPRLARIVDVDHQPALDARAQCGQLLGHRRQGGGAHHDLRLAVVDDVGGLAGRQVRVDAGVVQPRPLGAALTLEQPRVVLHEEGHVVETLQALVPGQLGDAVGCRLVLSEAERVAGARHDDRRPVGRHLGVLAGEHEGNLGHHNAFWPRKAARSPSSTASMLICRRRRDVRRRCLRRRSGPLAGDGRRPLENCRHSRVRGPQGSSESRWDRFMSANAQA